MAVTKLRILDIALKAMGSGLEGVEKPKQAHTANTKNMAARENKVYLDNFVTGDNANSAKLESSQRNRGRKKSGVYSIAGAGIYDILHITMRSNGSSKIMGAAIVPTIALPNAVFNP